MLKYHIITFGCQTNISDSERIATALEKEGHKPAKNQREADLIVINMCSIRKSAVDRAFGKIHEYNKLKAKNPRLKTILTGCITKYDRKKFAKKFDQITDKKYYLDFLPKYQSEISASVTISNGCDNFCTYCVVPYTRGRLVSRNSKNVLNEIKNSVKNGCKEIWMLGQNVNEYKYGKTDFPRLLESANKIEGNFWIRFTSSHPKDFTDKMIETMAKSEKITPYLNLPVQSGDDEILKKMNRPYTAKQYELLVKKIRQAFRKYRKGLEGEIAISTDVIVGFPGETKTQFQNTSRLFKRAGFDMAYISEYSARPGTQSAKMKDNIPHKEKEKRKEILNDILRKTALENNKKYEGKTVEVLIDEEKNGELRGKTRSYKTVKFEGKKSSVGKIINVKILKALPWGLLGKK